LTAENSVYLDGKYFVPSNLEVLQNEEFKALVETIKKHIPNFQVEDLEVTTAYQGDARVLVGEEEEDILPVEWLEFHNKRNTVEIDVFTVRSEKGETRQTLQSRIDTEKGEENLIGFDVVDGKVVQSFSQEGKIVVGEVDLPNNPDYVAGQTVSASGVMDFCLYGTYRHCGKKCGDGKTATGGGGTPINAIDTCCRTHDNCYRANLSTACCDLKLKNCIDANKSASVGAWLDISTWLSFRTKKC